MKNLSVFALLLACGLCLGLALPLLAAGEPAPVCSPPAVAAAPAVPAAGTAPALPEPSAPVLADPIGFTPSPRPAACPPLAAGCCRLYVPGYPCPMCDGFGCD